MTVKPRTIDAHQIASKLPKRKAESHKGNHGEVLVIGGAERMLGAALLAARCALFAGAGRVYVGFICADHAIPHVDLLHPELMLGKAEEMQHPLAVHVLGPGLGTSAHAQMELCRRLVETRYLVLDADALNLIAASANLQSNLSARRAAGHHTLLTPHPLEAARLLQTEVNTVQADRPSAALELARRFGAHIILKGAGSLIADLEQQLWLNPTGNPGLASAGTGDVLAGLCAALWAQSMASHAATLPNSALNDAAISACFIHGQAADHLLAAGIGPIGMSASELLPAIRDCINRFNANQLD